MFLQADTSRVIWAYHTLDPNSDNSLGNLRHQKMGSVSLNLLGRNNEDRNEPNTDFFILKNDNVSSIYSHHPTPNPNCSNALMCIKYCSWRFLVMILHTGAQFSISQIMLGRKKNTSIRSVILLGSVMWLAH